MEELLNSRASIHIIEDDEGRVEVYCEVEPELTEEQKAGEEDLTLPQYIAGALVEGVGRALEAYGMEKLSVPNADEV